MVFAALVAALIVTIVLVLGGGTSYEVHARFQDAGQLVKGDLVEVGGRPIGTIPEINLADNGQADVTLKITDGNFDPLHRGTVARIRTVGLSGVANRFVDIEPGPPTGEKIEDGGTLSVRETRPVIDLDQLLNDLDQPTRDSLQGVIRDGSKLAPAARDFNQVLAYLNPAVAQIRQTANEIVADSAAVERLIEAGARTAAALASRRDDLRGGITTTARTLEAVAAERAALSDLLGRAPVVLQRSRSTFANIRSTLTEVRPALRELRPVAEPLARVLRRLVPASEQAIPAIQQLNSYLPDVSRALRDLPAVARVAVPALRSATSAVGQSMPVFSGLRPYSVDVVHGFFNAFGGQAANYYDANGHFGRLTATFGGPGLTGPLSALNALLGGLGNAADPASLRTKLTARCPGGASAQARDKSNPYFEDPANCDPEQTPK